MVGPTTGGQGGTGGVGGSRGAADLGGGSPPNPLVALLVTTLGGLLLIAFFVRRRRRSDELVPGDPAFASASVAAAAGPARTPVISPLLAAKPKAERKKPAANKAAATKAATNRNERFRIGYRSVRLGDGPDDLRSIELGRLDQGDEVEILGSHEGFLQVRTPAGLTGWIPRHTITGSPISAS